MIVTESWLQLTFHIRQKDPSSPHKRRRVFTQRGTTLVDSVKEPTSDIASKLLATSPDHGGHPSISNSCTPADQDDRFQASSGRSRSASHQPAAFCTRDMSPYYSCSSRYLYVFAKLTFVLEQPKKPAISIKETTGLNLPRYHSN